MKNFFKAFEKNISKQVKSIGKGIADFDKDGVPNYKDCEPFNSKKHGVEPNILMAEKYKKLNIYVTDEPRYIADEKQLWYHFMSKEARQKAPIARKQVLSTLKRVPELITRIIKGRPFRIYFTSRRAGKGELGVAHPFGFVVIYGMPKYLLEALKKGEKETEKHFPGKYDVRKLQAVERGKTLGHELKHIQQFRERRVVSRTAAKFRKSKKVSYEESPIEKEARTEGKKIARKSVLKRDEKEKFESFRRLF